MFPVIVVCSSSGRIVIMSLNQKVTLVFSAPLLGWGAGEVDEQVNGEGDMMATITEISSLKMG